MRNVCPCCWFDSERQRLPDRTPGVRPRRTDGVAIAAHRHLRTRNQPAGLSSGHRLRLEAGGELELQLHYTATGTAGTDRTSVGMIFSKDPAPREVLVSQFFNTTLRLPARASEVRVDANVGFRENATVWGLFPHTHLRGKKWEYRLVLPDGSDRMILSVPKYDFNWQTYYMFREPLQVPKGSRIVSTAWYDNSGANRSNPNPKVDVFWGDQTWEEMQYTGLLFSAGVPTGGATAGQ